MINIVLTMKNKSSKLGQQPWIVKELLTSKLSYIAMYSCMGTLLPYMNVFLVSVGLSISQSGFVSGLRTIPSFFVTPVIGALADFTQQHKIILLILVALHMFVTFPLPWIAEAINNQHLNNATMANFTNATIPKSSDVTAGENLFPIMLIMVSFTALFGMPLMGFIDSAVMILVDKHKLVTSFGRQRVFGPIGFALGSFLGGVASDHYNHLTLSKYTGGFYLYLVSVSFLFLCLCVLSQKRPIDEVIIDIAEFKNTDGDEDELVKPNLVWPKNEIKTTRLSSSQRFVLLLTSCRQMRVLFFFIITAHMGCNFSLINGYMILHMETLGATKTLMGIAIAMSPISEIIAFPLSSKFIKCVGGIYPSFSIAIASYAVRFLLMSFIEDPWLFLPVQFLQCFGFAIFWVAATEHVHHISSTAISATLFNTVSTLYYSFGNLIGSVVGGVIYQRYGGQILFQACAIKCALMTSLVLIFYFCFEKKDQNKKEDFIRQELTVL